MNVWIRYLIALVVASHGLTYALYGLIVLGPLKAWSGTSTVLQAAGGDGRGTLMGIVHVAAGVAILASGLAIGFAPSIPGWWRPLAIGGALVGLAGFGLFYDGRVEHLVEEGIVGAAVSVALLVGAVAFTGAFD